MAAQQHRNEPDQYIDLKALSRRLGLSPRTIRSLIADPLKPLPAYRVGGKYLFLSAEVKEWIGLHRVKPPDLGYTVDAIMGDLSRRTKNEKDQKAES